MREYLFKTDREIMTCRDCPMVKKNRLSTTCPLKEGAERRCGTCPLVEVPTHDDLISRRDAIDAVYGYHFNNHPMKELEELPSVIPASEGMENKPYYSDPSCKNNMWDGE